MLFDVDHTNIIHFSGKHVSQGSSTLGHCNVKESTKRTGLSNISKQTLTHKTLFGKLVLISFGHTQECLVVFGSVSNGVGYQKNVNSYVKKKSS